MGQGLRSSAAMVDAMVLIDVMVVVKIPVGQICCGQKEVQYPYDILYRSTPLGQCDVSQNGFGKKEVQHPLSPVVARLSISVTSVRNKINGWPNEVQYPSSYRSTPLYQSKGVS